MGNLSPRDLRASLASFVQWRHDHLTGDEKGDAQIFCDRLFQALGHGGVREAGAVLEARIKKQDARGTAFADLLWKPRVIIEMKRSGTNLARHYRQAFQYWTYAVPNRPRYVVLCNFDEFLIYDFNLQMDAPVDVLRLDDLPSRSDALAFLFPDEQAPIFTNDLVTVTRDAAAAVASVFRSLHGRGVDRKTAQQFTLQSVVALFSEDIGLLPGKFFSRAVQEAQDGSEAYDLIGGLFTAMNTPGITQGGRYKGTPYFNGGIFSVVAPVDLTMQELENLRAAARTDWSGVRPEIFGTLFEGSMDAGERHALGAHFTSQADIAKVIVPVIVAPWQEKIQAATTIRDYEQILLEMSTYRVLDPACGSGNFLYVAYREMRRLEAEVNSRISERRRSAGLAGQQSLSYVTPDHFYGIDKNPFAVEVAKVTMMFAKKLAADELDENPDVLPLDNLDSTIVAGDALFDPWPAAHAIVGNPPYMGRQKMVEKLGASYTSDLSLRHPQVGSMSDFVCYWFPLAHDHLPLGGRAGFVATQAIRDSSSRRVALDYIIENDGAIYDAVSVQPWTGDAVVHVSIVNWVKGHQHAPVKRTLWLDQGELPLPLPSIPASLRPSTDVALAQPLAGNRKPKVCFQGQTTGLVKGFRLSAESAQAIGHRDMKSDKYIYPVISGDPLLHEVQPEIYVIDLPFTDIIEAEANAPELVKYLRSHVLPSREKAAAKEAKRNQEALAKNPKARVNVHHARFLDVWWRHSYRREDLLEAVSQISRYIALTIVAGEGRKSVYQFVDSGIRPDASLQAFAFDDDYSFGVLSSQLHRDWFNERCSRLKVDPRYTPSTVFDSFPWPSNPSVEGVTDVVSTVRQILDLRASYLSRGITLSQQYDALRQPGQSQLGKLHAKLDDAVLALYGFSATDDVLAQLLALNLAYGADPATAVRPGAQRMNGVHSTTYRLTMPEI